MTTLYDAFLQSAQTHASRTALINYHTGEKTTYQALQSETDHLAAAFLTHCRIMPGQRVGLLLSNQKEFVSSFFALQSLGAVAIPLSSRLSSHELEKILLDAGASGLVSSLEYAAVVAPVLKLLAWYVQNEPMTLHADCNVFSLQSWLMQTTDTDAAPVPSPAPDDLAVLIYTSGTTGKPKGVMLSHRNLVEDALANTQVIEAIADDVFITVSPLFHVFGLTNVMLTALLNGASIVVVRKFTPRSILDGISQYRVTFLAAVPTMYQMMLTFLPSPEIDLSSLRVCHSGAAPMPVAIFNRIERVFNAPVQEGYGQSEASSIITSNPLHGTRKPGSIGLPLPGLTVEIVDESGQPLPPGEVGELRVKGPTVMLGYWQNEAATVRALQDGWLYTSDMGFKDEEGYIFLSGRRDDLINVGGAKVYPQEVEEVLYQYPGVSACAVAAVPSSLYHQVVAAFIVPANGQDINIPDLQRFCRGFLAEYKIPRQFYPVAEIPKGPTGKILRHKLVENLPETNG